MKNLHHQRPIALTRRLMPPSVRMLMVAQRKEKHFGQCDSESSAGGVLTGRSTPPSCCILNFHCQLSSVLAAVT